MSDSERTPWWENDPPDVSYDQIRNSAEQARSLSDLAERAVMEVSGDFDESPFDQGGQYTFDRLHDLAAAAEKGVPLNDSNVQAHLDRLPDVIRPYAEDLYRDALRGDEGDDIIHGS